MLLRRLQHKRSTGCSQGSLCSRPVIPRWPHVEQARFLDSRPVIPCCAIQSTTLSVCSCTLLLRLLVHLRLRCMQDPSGCQCGARGIGRGDSPPTAKASHDGGEAYRTGSALRLESAWLRNQPGRTTEHHRTIYLRSAATMHSATTQHVCAWGGEVLDVVWRGAWNGGVRETIAN